MTWIPESADLAPMDAIIDLLNTGKYDQAAPMLETLLQANPNDFDALYNLGMVYSDQGRLKEARDLLHRATEISPEHANSFVALGVAAQRDNDLAAARSALERAVELEPDNIFALRTLGALYSMAGDLEDAIKVLRHAVATTPSDPIALLTLAQTLLQVDPDENATEADDLLCKVLQLSPRGEVAEKAKDARRTIASRTFRSNSVGELRPDAVMYCLGALERFEGLDHAQLAPIMMELATLGQNGLPVNDNEKQFKLRLLPGEFSALQIVCMMHVGMKMVDPELGSGFDIDREYEAALSMHKCKQ